MKLQNTMFKLRYRTHGLAQINAFLATLIAVASLIPQKDTDMEIMTFDQQISDIFTTTNTYQFTHSLSPSLLS